MALSEREVLADRFWGEPDCCLDEFFALRLKNLCTSSRDLLDSPWHWDSLRLWARFTHLSNMHVERLLARMKCSSNDKRPPIQRLVCTALLTQWLHVHRSCTGAGPRSSQSRKTLPANCVPLRAQRRKQTSKRRGGRAGSGVMAFVRKMQAKGKRPKAYRNSERRRLFARFNAMATEER